MRMKPKTSLDHALRQAELASRVNLPYKPSEAYVGAAIRPAGEGLLERGIGGGFHLTAAGIRELARQK